MKFTRIPETTFKNIQLNAGILAREFNPDTQEINGLLGATTGGINFNATPTFEDFGDDIDNCPKNTMELKKLTEWEVSLSGTFVTMTAETAHTLVGAADTDPVDSTKIIPRKDVLLSDYKDIWWVGDYSDVNVGVNAGFCAIHMFNSLNTGGFQIQSNDKGKGNFAFTFTGHVSMDAQDVVPFELYIKGGTSLEVILAPEAGDTRFPWTELTPSDFQENVRVSGNDVLGTLKYIEDGLSPSGPLSGSGNFLALKFNAEDWSKFTSVKVGLDPSQGTGMVEIIDDPDKNGVFKITANTQVIKLAITTLNGDVFTETYSLADLVLETE